MPGRLDSVDHLFGTALVSKARPVRSLSLCGLTRPGGVRRAVARDLLALAEHQGDAPQT